VTDLNKLVNDYLVPQNLTGTTYASLYKKTAQKEENLDKYWDMVSNPTAQLLFDDRTELLQMISCFNLPGGTNLTAFFKTTDYYTEYFETTDSNFSNVKSSLIEPKIKAFYEKNKGQIHGPMILIVWQSPKYTMKEGTVAIRNGNISSVDYNYQARYPLDNKDPIRFSFYLMAPLHKPDGLADISRTKQDICPRVSWLKTLASRDNSCFIQLPGDTSGSFGGCQNQYLKESWKCVDNPTINGIYRRNVSDAFECLTVDKKTCKKLNNRDDCENTLRSYSEGLIVSREADINQLSQLLPTGSYRATCMGPGSGSETDKIEMNYGIAYFINPNFTSMKGLFDDVAIYPFDESRLGKCPKEQPKALSIIDILKRDSELLLDSEIDISSIKSPNTPQKIDMTKDVVYTISYWIWLANYHPWWRNIFLHGSDNNNRAPAMFVHEGTGYLHAAQASTRTWNETINSKTKLLLNQWYHITLMVSGNVMSLYVNGTLEDQLTLPANTKFKWSANSNPINRMNYNMIPHNQFTPGNRIKQFRWFNRALTKDELNNLRYLS
jgi:hypothetical protein